MPDSHPPKADLTSLAEAGLERRVAAELAHIVVRPDDGVGAQTNVHGSVFIQAPLTSERVALASRSDLLALRDLRHRHVPPVPARLGTGGRIGFDDEHAGARGLARRGEGVGKFRDARRLAYESPEAARVRDEVERALGAPRETAQVVEARISGAALQPLDAAEAAIVQNEHDPLQ